MAVSSVQCPVSSSQCSVSSTRKAQVSLELLITLGVVLAFTLPLLFLILSVSSVGYESAAKDQADATARNLAESINIVYAQGDGAKRTILLNSPSNTQGILIKQNEVIVELLVSEGTYEAASPVFAKAKLVGEDIEGRQGLIYIKLENSEGVVEVSLSE